MDWMVNYHIWKKSAFLVRDRCNNKQAPSNDNYKNGKFVVDEVRVANICNGKKYRGHRTKPTEMEFFLTNIISTAIKDIFDLVLFSDSDAVFNFNAVAAHEVIDRFYHIIQNAQRESAYKKVRDYNSLVISAENTCWIGQLDCGDVLPRYPILTRGKSNCPQFVNSGGYMGTPNTILQVIQYQLNLTEQDAVGKIKQSDQALLTTFYLNHHHYTPPAAQIAFRAARNESHIKDIPIVAILDRQASIFRSLYVGFFDVNNMTKTGPYTCGSHEGMESCGGVKGRSDPTIFEEMTGTSLVSVAYPPVPNVTAQKCLHPQKGVALNRESLNSEGGSAYLERYPFHIHGNGMTKKQLHHVQSGMFKKFYQELKNRKREAFQ
jgi:hypothetical protein